MRVETEGEERGVEANRTKNLFKLCSGEAWEYLTLWSLQSRNKLNNYQHLLFLSLFGVTDGFCLQYEKICQNVHNESERSIYKSIQWLRYPTVTRHYIVILMRIYIYIVKQHKYCRFLVSEGTSHKSDVIIWTYQMFLLVLILLHTWILYPHYWWLLAMIIVESRCQITNTERFRRVENITVTSGWPESKQPRVLDVKFHDFSMTFHY